MNLKTLPVFHADVYEKKKELPCTWNWVYLDLLPNALDIVAWKLLKVVWCVYFCKTFFNKECDIDFNNLYKVQIMF